MNIGEVVTQYELTQAQLAKLLGSNRRSILRYNNGNNVSKQASRVVYLLGVIQTFNPGLFDWLVNDAKR